MDAFQEAVRHSFEKSGFKRAEFFAVFQYGDTMIDRVVQCTVLAVHAHADGKYGEIREEVSRNRSPLRGLCNVPETVKVGDVLPLRPWG